MFGSDWMDQLYLGYNEERKKIQAKPNQLAQEFTSYRRMTPYMNSHTRHGFGQYQDGTRLYQNQTGQYRFVKKLKKERS